MQFTSHRSGIPRDFAIGVVVGRDGDHSIPGLPPIQANATLPCPGVKNNGSCTRSDLLKAVKEQKPVFAPNQKSTYCNDAYELLGLVLETVTGQDYGDYIAGAILKPLNMTMSSFATPPDDHAVIAQGKSAIWDVKQGVQRPTGGMYASASDLSKFLRYALRNYNSIATGVNWLLPVSWATGMQTFYGMPWEILRSETVLEHSRRPVTIVAKSGGLPGYVSQIFLLPEYDLGVTILVAGDIALLDQLQEIVLVNLIKAAEAAIWDHVATVYTGDLVAMNSFLNSSLSLRSKPEHGLTVSKFISNGTDMLGTGIPQFLAPFMTADESPWHAQLVPTLLFKNESTKQGEIWRMLVVQERMEGRSGRGVFDGMCLTNIDTATYNSLPLNEVVFWHDQGLVELPAFQVVFKTATGKDMADASWPASLANVLQHVIG
jgi:CubicO group peptidase (beta-lactamase class C family)